MMNALFVPIIALLNRTMLYYPDQSPSGSCHSHCQLNCYLNVISSFACRVPSQSTYLMSLKQRSQFKSSEEISHKTLWHGSSEESAREKTYSTMYTSGIDQYFWV